MSVERPSPDQSPESAERSSRDLERAADRGAASSYARLAHVVALHVGRRGLDDPSGSAFVRFDSFTTVWPFTVTAMQRPSRSRHFGMARPGTVAANRPAIAMAQTRTVAAGNLSLIGITSSRKLGRRGRAGRYGPR